MMGVRPTSISHPARLLSARLHILGCPSVRASWPAIPACLGGRRRSAAGAASNLNDAQGAGETHLALSASLQANTTLTLHLAGRLEGGLAFGYHKLIPDIGALQTLGELCQPIAQDEDS